MNPENHKAIEKEILIELLFPTPYAGSQNTLLLFSLCRELGDEYCLSFNDLGYTSDYKPFDSKEVIKRSTQFLTDDRLLSYFENNKNQLNPWRDFYGKYYTYEKKIKRLRIGSEWDKIEKNLDEFHARKGKQLHAVLMAIWEANVDLNKRNDNW